MERNQGRAELIAILQELAQRAHASALFTEPVRLLALWRAVFVAHCVQGLGWERADSALRRVHQLEQAALLYAAAEMRLAACEEGRLFTAPSERPALEAWLERCAEEIAFALSCRAAIPGDLLVCWLVEPAGWPSAAELARAACALDSSARSRLLLVRARYAEGRRAAAERGYRALLLSVQEPRVIAQAREALGCACERSGRRREALAHFEQAAAQGAGLRAEVSSLGLALVLGERACAHWAAERLEQRALALPCAVRFAREVRARWELEDDGVERALRAGEPALLRGLLSRGGTPVAQVCGELFPCSVPPEQ